MNIFQDTHNALLKRREISLKVSASSNPGFTQALNMIAEKTHAKEEQIVIKAVRSTFGSNMFVIEAYVYNTRADKERVEPRKKVRKEKEAA